MINRSDLCPCGRIPQGFAFTDPNKFNPETIHYCSMEHMKMQLTLDKREKEAVSKASANIGQYLDDLGKYDFSKMSYDEWIGFLETVHIEICKESVPY